MRQSEHKEYKEHKEYREYREYKEYKAQRGKRDRKQSGKWINVKLLKQRKCLSAILTWKHSTCSNRTAGESLGGLANNKAKVKPIRKMSFVLCVKGGGKNDSSLYIPVAPLRSLGDAIFFTVFYLPSSAVRVMEIEAKNGF